MQNVQQLSRKSLEKYIENVRNSLKYVALRNITLTQIPRKFMDKDQILNISELKAQWHSI